MLSVRPKIAQLTFQLYDRSVHPELFDDCAHRRYERDRYRLDVQITSAGHVIKWTDGKSVLTEVAASAHQPLPEQRRLLCHTISGTRSESIIYRDSVSYENDLGNRNSRSTDICSGTARIGTNEPLRRCPTSFRIQRPTDVWCRQLYQCRITTKPGSHSHVSYVSR